MKKLIVTILLVSVLGCGCGLKGVNLNKEETLSHSEENQQTNQGVNEEVIENPTPQKAEE